MAKPAPRSAPAIRNNAASRAASRAARHEQRVQQRRQDAAAPAKTATPSAAAKSVERSKSVESNKTAAPSTQQAAKPERLQQLQSKKKLDRAERRELRQLRREERQNAKSVDKPDDKKAIDERQNAKQDNPQQQSVQSNRLQDLQSKKNLSRSERREMRRLQRDEKRNAQQDKQPDNAQRNALTDPQRDKRLQELQSKNNLSRAERRELRQLRREDRRDARQEQRQEQRQDQRQDQRQAQRADRRAARAQISQQQARQGRFAANARTANASNRHGRRAARRAARLAARTAWQLGLLAPYIPWRGPVYYPYAYNDVFYYTFWPDAYDPGYWAYAYDDFFDGVFFPDGAPYEEYAAEGPYTGAYASNAPSSTTGSAPARTASPGRLTKATKDFCAEQAKGVTGWPLEKISEAVQPNAEQKGLLDDLKKASEDAAEQLKQACPDAVPMTPGGRLQAMTMRLQATVDAVKVVKPPLEKFYESLSDEQKARFNEVGPAIGKSQQPQRPAGNEQEAAQANCSSEKAGLSGLTVDRIEQTLDPTDAQEDGLDRLDTAMQKAVDTLRDACPNTTPLTPVGRLDVMQKRLEAMISAANTVRPALEDFYTSLSDEQKAKFNRLGRDTAKSGG